MGIPPAKETFFQVAMRTCFGWNVSVPTIASLAGRNMWSNNWRNMRKFQSSSHDPSKTKELPSQRKRYWKLNINTNLISAFSHSLISMPSLSFLEYKSRSNLDELKFISGGVWSTWCQDEASTTTYVTNHSGPLLLCTTGLKFNRKPFYSVLIFPSLDQTVPWLSALDHNDHHNQREHHCKNDAFAPRKK